MKHDSEEIEHDIDVFTEENFCSDKDKLVRTGIMQINQLYNKKMQLVNRETAT